MLGGGGAGHLRPSLRGLKGRAACLCALPLEGALPACCPAWGSRCRGGSTLPASGEAAFPMSSLQEAGHTEAGLPPFQGGRVSNQTRLLTLQLSCSHRWLCIRITRATFTCARTYMMMPGAWTPGDEGPRPSEKELPGNEDPQNHWGRTSGSYPLPFQQSSKQG